MISLYNRLKRRTFEVVEMENPDKSDILNTVFDSVIIAFIIINILAVVIETVPTMASIKWLMGLFGIIEIVSVIVFTLEYMLRLWSITCDPNFAHPVLGRLKFIFGFMPLVDLIAITPFYLTLIMPVGIDLRFMRIIRLFRFLRLIKLARYTTALKNMITVIQTKKADILVTLSIVVLLTLFSASLLYFVENDAQPDKFRSIPDSMWWAICTLTTVGYGDIFPITWLGKIITAFITLLSIGLIALPAGIVVSGYQEISSKKQKEETDNKEGKTLEDRVKNIENILQEINSKLDS